MPFATFLNGNTQAANDLHFRVSTGLSIEILLDNAPGCAVPTVTRTGTSPILFDVVWPTACIDPNEYVSVAFFSNTCTGVPHPCASPVVDCFNYTLDGGPLDSPDTCGTATPTATATPVAGHDGKAKRIAAANFVVLSDGTPDLKNLDVWVRNDGDHAEVFGVYADIVPPGGISNPYGCFPSGRIIDMDVALDPGKQTVVSTSQDFGCADVTGALGQTYTITAAVDVHADDGGGCPVFQIQSTNCYNALADDDDDDGDNRVMTSGFRVR